MSLKNNPWVQAARIRTLLLSVSGIILGSFYALSQSYFNWKILGFGILTTIGLQVLSNYANDYGDGVKGTDNDNRVGPKRAIQSGAITPEAMKTGIIITALLTLFFAICLIYVAFSDEYLVYSLFFLALGILAILSAVKYTVGKKAYGYFGFGDLFVFVFFGWVSVLGTYFLYTKQMDYLLVLPASALGFLSAGVLNLNNMRDVISDAQSQKNTLVVKMGLANAKIYHYSLLGVSILLTLLFAILYGFRIDQYLFVLVFIPLVKHGITVYKNQEARLLDSELKTLALSTFVLAILLSMCLIF
jgi:1,4-dihydroxy-2-naphthoate polyprenyltransferase